MNALHWSQVRSISSFLLPPVADSSSEATDDPGKSWENPLSFLPIEAGEPQ
ncbi:MAG: hypothetical protein ACT4QC_12345 [Planctomycetaceae bacterium]